MVMKVIGRLEEDKRLKFNRRFIRQKLFPLEKLSNYLKVNKVAYFVAESVLMLHARARV